MRVKLLAIITLVLAGLLSQAVSANTLAAIKQRKKIIVAIDISSPPFGMLDSKAQQTGSEVESARLLAQDLGVKLEVVPVTGASRVPFLLTKKVDIVMSSFSITEERKKVIDFSLPYSVNQLVVAGASSQKLSKLTDLSGKTIAVARGTTNDQELSKVSKSLSGINIVRYEDDATTNTAVATGQQDYIVTALGVVSALQKVNPARGIQPKLNLKAYPMGIGMRKNEPALKSYLDGWVKTNLNNGKLNTIYKKYFGQDLPKPMPQG